MTPASLENSDGVDGDADKEVYSCALLGCGRYFHNRRPEVLPPARDGGGRSSNGGRLTGEEERNGERRRRFATENGC
jgi:hypothetical protein